MINKQGDENLKEKEKIISLAASYKAEGGLVTTKRSVEFRYNI